MTHTQVLSHTEISALVERVLHDRVKLVTLYVHGIVNAVYFVSLANGQECVVRVSAPEYRQYVEMEVWAQAQAGAAGVPVPEVLAWELRPAYFATPFVITRRAPGVPGDTPSLAPAERLAAYRDLGRHMARMHAVQLPGFGPLTRTAAGFAGRDHTLWERLTTELAHLAQALPELDRPLEHLARALQRFQAHRAVFALRSASLVHGDLQGKNFLVQGGRVTAIIDFECAEAGDPVMDFHVMDYWNRHDRALLDALVTGYGGELGSSSAFRRRVYLYELFYALHRLRSAYERKDSLEAEHIFARMTEIEKALDAV